MLRSLLETLRSFLVSDRLNREIAEELRHHVEARAADLERGGMTPAAARRRARVELGSAAAAAGGCREARGLRRLDEARRNTAFALRQLRRNPAFAVSAVLTLGLCIGANTAVFSAVDAILLRALPYPDADRLALLEVQQRGGVGEDSISHSGRTWEILRDPRGDFDAAVFKIAGEGANLAVGEQAELVEQQRVGAGFFRVLGILPAAGRGFEPAEDRRGGPAVCVLSHELATRLFGGTAAAVGRTVQLKGEPQSVVGVMPAGFRSTVAADLWIPLQASTQGEGGGRNYQILVRPVDGLSLRQAEQAMAPLLEEIVEGWPKAEGGSWRLRLTPLRQGLTQGAQQPLLLLWAAAGAVLLIGCVNIAGLLTARLQARAHELALRRALGGGRGAVFRQLLTESLTLGLAGGLAGAAVGWATTGALRALLQDGLGVERAFGLDARGFALAEALSIGCGLLFGLFPALLGGREELGLTLQSGGRHGTGRGTALARRALVAAQTAACLVLLAGAGLMIRTLLTLRGLDPGFDPSHVVAAEASLDDARYRTAAATARLFEESLRRIEQAPGVEAAGVGQSLPYERAVNLGLRIEGRPAPEGYQPVDVIYVAGDYFGALRISLARGRLLQPSDGAEQEPVAVVNRAFLDYYLPGGDALSKYLTVGGERRRIVGVVASVQQRRSWNRSTGPLAPAPTVYVPVGQVDDRGLSILHTWSTPSWVVRTRAPLGQADQLLRSSVAAVDPLLPVTEFRTMQQVRGEAWATQRVQATLLAALAALALALAAVGIYGLIAGLALERSKEAAIRLALGAGRFEIVRSTMLPGLAWTGVGIAAGLLLTPAAGRLIESLVWGVEPGDPLSLTVAAAVLMVAAAAASLAPALRLLRVRPAALLREE
ncbi:MAG: FtsX-like permease family protein [Acidobacteria bacterium]|nr:FtsX-like permease family protein [Acidobacteriota bacterium]